MLIVLKANVSRMQLAEALDIDLVVAVNQDVGNVVVAQKRFERTQAEQLVLDLLDQADAVGVRQQASLFVQDLAYRRGDFRRHRGGFERLELRDVDSFKQAIVNFDF